MSVWSPIQNPKSKIKNFYSILRLRPRPFGQRRGQIAAMLTVGLAICVLLLMMTINVGQVAVTKTATANAADAASLGIMSSVGTISRQLALALGDGEKYEKKKCKTNLFSIFMIVLIVVLVVVAAAAAGLLGAALQGAMANLAPALGYTTTVAGGVGSGGATTLGVTKLAIAAATLAGTSALSLGIQAGIVDPAIARAFNKQFKKLGNLKDKIRENGILTAFLRTVDDPNSVLDARDIDEDGDTSERISAFADWYDRRLDDLGARSQAQAGAVAAQAAAIKSSLNAIIPPMEAFRDYLDNPETADTIDGPFVGLLAWIESLGIEVPFWQPGDQTSSPLEPDDCPDNCPDEVDSCPDGGDFTGPCGPGVTAIPDEVDWMVVRLSDFIGWAKVVVSLDDTQFAAVASQVSELLKELFLPEMEKWSTMVGGWITTLQRLQPLIPWPPAPVVDPVTNVQTGWNPPTLPPFPECPGNDPALCPASPHPIAAGIAPLQDARTAMDSFNPPTVDVEFNPVSTDSPIYSWKDNRGWHHVQVEVTPFKIPRMKASSGFFTNCVRVKHAQQEVKVTVTRYDQDNAVGRGWTMRYRANATDTTFDSETEEARHDSSPETFLAQGIKSVSKARHGYKPNSVWLVKDAVTK